MLAKILVFFGGYMLAKTLVVFFGGYMLAKTLVVFFGGYMLAKTLVVCYGGYMLVKTLVVLYVWSPDIFVLFYQNQFSGIVYSIMSNKILPHHTIPCSYKYKLYLKSNVIKFRIVNNGLVS